MNSNITAEDILGMVFEPRQQLSTRELSSREITEDSQKTREVYKDKKIKRGKESSREVHEEPLPFLPSAPCGQTSSEVSPEGLESQETEIVLSAHENLTSRVYSGISVYHNRTDRGIKLNITLQSQEDVELGACVEITAELKSQDRFYEIKNYAGDDPEYQEFVQAVIKIYRERPETYAIGRAHARGKRSAWYSNTLIVGQLRDGVVVHVTLFLINEQYDIAMNMPLNTNQSKFYHSGGIYGILKSTKKVPSLATAERKRFNP